MPATASNDPARLSWSRLSRAFGRATGDRPAGELIETLLRLAREASGSERAFVVGTRGDGIEVHATSSSRGDGSVIPSRTVLLRALAVTKPTIWSDLARRPLPAVSRSVRSLSLRSFLAVPIPTTSPQRSALVLDSRLPLRAPELELRARLELFAALAGLAFQSPAGPSSLPLASSNGQSPDPGAPPLETASRCRAQRELSRWVGCIAATSLPVLILGASGSGKERVARAVHTRSSRQAGPFVAVNCTAITETLIEAELFGAVRGAYTGSDRDRPGLFRLAHSGTLFLDEIGDMPLSMQAKLLRTLQEGRIRPVGGAHELPVDVRLVAASHRDLARQVTRGAFRADLYYRIAVLPVRVPSLRERIEDLPTLVDELSPRIREETGAGLLRLTQRAWEVLRAHDWPGNVRELHSVLARGVLRAAGGEIDARHLEPLGPPSRRSADEPGASLEQRMIEGALRSAGGNLAEAAAGIGWTRQKLYRRMKALRVSRS